MTTLIVRTDSTLVIPTSLISCSNKHLCGLFEVFSHDYLFSQNRRRLISVRGFVCVCFLQIAPFTSQNTVCSLAGRNIRIVDSYSLIFIVKKYPLMRKKIAVQEE